MADLATFPPGTSRPAASRPASFRLGTGILLAAAIGLAACARQDAPGHVEIADDGEEAGWLVRGPFPWAGTSPFSCALDRDFLADEGGEAAARPGRIRSAGDRSWREAAGEPSSLDFLVAFAEEGRELRRCVGYAYREIRSEAEREAVLKVGSDDGVKVWLNGVLVLAEGIDRSLSADQDAAVVRLAAGMNRLLVKVEQAEGEWGFALRLREVEEDRAEGAAARIDGLRLALSARNVTAGGALRGLVVSEPAFALDESAAVDLLGPDGTVLASAEARLSREFSLEPPPGHSGPLRVVARGLGALSGLEAEAWAVAGDAAAVAAAAAGEARQRAAESRGSAAFPDGAASLSFLADLAEGLLPRPLEGYDAASRALARLEALGRAPPSGERAPRNGESLPRPFGLAYSRAAFRSAVDGSLQPYSLYLPADTLPGRPLGLVLVLHPSGGDDEGAIAPFARAAPRDLAVLAPYARGDLGYAGPAGRDVDDLLAATLERYAIDPRRVYLAGSSMGAFGAWKLALERPGAFAAVAAFSGWTFADGLEPLVGTPVLAVHGEADGIVTPRAAAAAVGSLAGLGSPAAFELLPGVGHDSYSAWTSGRGAGRLLGWFAGKASDPWPSSVAVRTSMAKDGSNRWASVTGLVRPREGAGLDARIADPRHIVVETTNVSSFELDLSHPALARGGRVLVLADGINVTADAGARASFALGKDDRFRSGKAGSGSSAPAIPAARNGGSGLAALFEGGVEIVYGTRVKRRAADLRAAAEALADWGSGGGSARQVLGAFPVRSDAEAAEPPPSTPSAYARGGRILVGSPSENAVAARLAQSLPLAFSRRGFAVGGVSFEGGGFLLVRPDPERPSALVALLSLPAGRESGLRVARDLAAELREYAYHDDAGGAATPDAVAFDAEGAVVWSASYDRDWATLTEDRRD